MSTSILHDAVKSSHELAPSTRSKYLRDLDAWVEFAGADEHAWSKKKAEEFEQTLIERGLTEDSANRVIVSLRFAMRRLATLSGDPSSNLLEDEYIKQTLTQEEIAKILAVCATDSGADLRDRALIVVALETGLRKMSLASMTVEHLWLKTETPAAWALIRNRGVEEDRVSIPLSDVAVAALKPWLAYLVEAQITRGPLFRGLIRRDGGFRPKNPGLSTSMIQKIIVARALNAGIHHVSPDTLRRTFTLWRSEAGLSPKEYLPEQMPGERTRRATPAWLKPIFGVS